VRIIKHGILLVSTFITIIAIMYCQKSFTVLASQPDVPTSSVYKYFTGTEPQKPVNIDDPPWNNKVFPTKTYPISEIVDKGTEIPLEFAYNNPDWKRQAYKSYWHSSVSAGRWSYVPSLIHYAMHRLFTTYPTASVYYDFIHDLGIAEESNQFTIKHDGPFDYINTVVMQAQVQKILTYGNQVVLIAKPMRNGLQVIDIPVSKINPINVDDKILFQLVTEQGDEIGYSLINYVMPKKNK